MNIEVLIYMYALICLALIAFDGMWLVIKYIKTKKMIRSEANYDQIIKDHLFQISRDQDVNKKNLKVMTKKLAHIDELKAFDLALQKHQRSNNIEPYIFYLGKIFADLSKKYEKQESINKAYFAYVIACHATHLKSSRITISEQMITYLDDKSVYCRENTLQALYQFGDEDYVVRALKILDNRGVYYNSKLLSDGLFAFSGNHEKLSLKLLELFPLFNQSMQIAIINYLKLTDLDFRTHLFEILIEEKANNELRFALIRYYGKHYYEPAKNILLEFLLGKNNKEWEFAALSARALSIYQEPQVVQALKKALSNKNWYVRFNGASSLVEMKASKQELQDIMDGNDRYAKEILQYSFDYKKLR